MRASTHKKKSGKSKKKQKKYKKNKLVVFITALCSVLAAGTLGLAFLAIQSSAENPTQSAEGTQREEAEPETILASISEQEEALTAEAGEEAAETTEADESRYGSLLADPELMKEHRIYAKEAASTQQIVMAFAGDILFDPHYAVMAKLRQRGGNIEEAFSADLLAQMRGADIFMVNNEFPYTDRGTPTEGKQFTFRAEPESAIYLKDMGADIVSLANNHAYDYGEVSLLDSLDTLEAMEMPYVGAGRNLEEAAAPVSFIVNDKKITIVSATQIERNDNPDTRGAGEDTPGTFRCWNPERLLQETAAAKADSDFVIVYIHWGTESQAEIDWAQREQAVKIAEAGADVIIGDHPHCLQPVGYVSGIPVVYSLGNFWFNSKAQDTCLVQVIIPEEGELSVRVLPARQSDCRTTLLSGGEKERVLSYINSISDSGVLDEDGYLSPR